MNHNQLKEKALKNKTVKEEYDRLKPEYGLLREMLKARNDVISGLILLVSTVVCGTQI